MEEEGQHLVPPDNFSTVEIHSIYRSGFPHPQNFPFLKTLQLKSLVYLCMEPYPEENRAFLQANNIKLFQFGIQGTKEPSATSGTAITEALNVLIDVRNHPVLIHCQRGKHRTGSLVGCLRKLQNWCYSSVEEEYKLFAGKKWRQTDVNFLQSYDVSSLRYCLQSIIYKYQGTSNKKRRLLYNDECVEKPRLTSVCTTRECSKYHAKKLIRSKSSLKMWFKRRYLSTIRKMSNFSKNRVS